MRNTLFIAQGNSALGTDSKPIAKDWEDLYSGLQIKPPHWGTEGATGNEERFNALQNTHSLLHQLGMWEMRGNPRLAGGPQPSLGEGFGIYKILTHGDPIFPYGGRLPLCNCAFLFCPF